MSPLGCPACGGGSLADDEFCEVCGTPLGRRRDADRNHVEIDAGIAAAVSDLGLVHARNEDAAYLAVTDRSVVAVVCDGVSSSAGSQVAAQVAAEVAGGALAGTSGPAYERMAGALRAAGAEVSALPWSWARATDPPSCTAVAALVEDETVTVGWAGDSRAYWVSDNRADRLTADHSWAQANIDSGTMTADEAWADRRAHAITRWLGPDQTSSEPSVISFTPSGRGHLVLCSDGLWNEFGTDEILVAVIDGARPRPIDIARALTTAALERGGHDNISVVVIPLEGMGRRASRSGRFASSA